MSLVRILVAVATLFAGLACLGCERPLGTNDLVLSYRSHALAPLEIESRVTARLSAAELTADVRATEDGVQVVVAEGESGAVERLLAWPGGVEIDAVESEGGEGPPDPERRALSASTDAAPQTVYVAATPRVDLRDGVATVQTRPDGRAIELWLTPEAVRRISAALPSLEHGTVAVALGREAIYVGPARSLAGVSETTPLTIPFGDALEAYSRARAVRLLLTTPTLPPLTRTSAQPARADVPLAIAALSLPFGLSVAWLFFVRRFDRAEPEPLWLVAATFALGGFGLVPASFAEVGWTHLSPWLDPSLVTMGARLEALPFALPVFVLVIGLTEETAKFMGAWSFAYHRREFDEPVDGIVYGSASALGFAAVENVKYFALGRLGAGLVAARMFITLPAHLFFGSIWGYALGQKLIRPRVRLFPFLALAALAHGAFDTFLSIERLAPLAFALNLGLASGFVVVLRRSLRHGVVTSDTLRAAGSRRELHVVGSPVGFGAATVALHAIAAALFLASSYAQSSHGKVGWPFFASMSLLVTLLGLSAWFISTTLPLDAVLDDYGVTFAGAARPWSSIRGVEPSPRGLHLRSSAGDVWIGPASKQAIDRITNEIGARLVSPIVR